MTTVINTYITISRVRKRPNEEDKWIKAEFKNQAFKSLNIPEFINMYNHFINSVDRADQIRTYYRINQRNYQTWKPLWNYLFQIIICNAALIWMDQDYLTKKKEGYLKFRTKLASQLIAHLFSFEYTSPIDEFGVRTNLRNHIITSRNGCNGTHDVISQSAKKCKAYMAQDRTV